MEFFTGAFSRIKTSGPSSTITMSLVPTRTSGIAPLAVTFDATGTSSTETSMPFQDILHKLNFGDDDSPTWDYGTRPWVLKKNRATGPVTAHVFETPGTYTVTDTGYDGTSYGTVTATITVLDPETVYAGSATICVSSSGLPVAGVGGVPAGAQCFQLATIELATAKITANNQRLLLKAGDTFTCSGTNNLPAYTGLTVGKYGTGAKPLINFITATTNYGALNPTADDCRIMDIQATTAISGTYTSRIVNHSRSNILLLRVDATYISSLAFHSVGTSNYTFECTLDSPGGLGGNVGLWMAMTTHGAAIGNSITNCHNIEHNIRTHCANYCAFSNNTLTNNAEGKHLQAYRGDSGGVYLAEKAVISDTLYDQGSTTFATLVQIAPTASSFDEQFHDILFERNVVYHRQGSATAGIVNVTAQNGVRVRNNIFYELGGGGMTVSYSDGSVNVTESGTDFASQNNSAWVAHTLGYSFTGLNTYKSPIWTGAVVENNLIYAPGVNADMNNSGTTGTPVWVGAGISTPANYVAYTNSTGSQIKNTAPAWTVQPPVALADFTPHGASYAIDAGTSAPIWEDFFGTLRTGTMDIGAVVG